MSEQIVSNFLEQYSLKLSPEFVIDSHYLEKGVWEEHVLNYIKLFVRSGSVCIDVGANIGLHTVSMAHFAGETGRVFAFEPGARTFPRLADNINLNKALRKRVVAEKLGLSDKEGLLKLFYSGELEGNAYMGESYNSELWNSGGQGDFELCIVTPLDDYLSDDVAVDFMKIDVEGMELSVLQGAIETIRRGRPVIVFETLVEYFGIQKIEACATLFEAEDYLLFLLDPAIGKLSKVISPEYQEDTVAIPRAKIPLYAEILANAAQYQFSLSEHVGNLSTLEFTLVQVDKDDFGVGVRAHWSSERVPFRTQFRNGQILAEGELGGKPTSLELSLLEAGARCNGQITHDGQSSALSGSLIGGALNF